jgi:hypothetical protein
MRFSAAAAENFQFFSSLGSDGWKFFGSRHQRLKFFKDLLKNFLVSRNFRIKRAKNDN